MNTDQLCSNRTVFHLKDGAAAVLAEMGLQEMHYMRHWSDIFFNLPTSHFLHTDRSNNKEDSVVNDQTSVASNRFCALLLVALTGMETQ